MNVFLTGGTGVLGRVAIPHLLAAGHEVSAPTREQLNLFAVHSVERAVAGRDAVVHLATRIPPPDQTNEPDAWADNDRLRGEASRILVDAALATTPQVYVQPTVTFVYPGEGPVDEATEIAEVPATLRSALVAEKEAARFAEAGRRGVVLRLGLLYGPGTGSDEPRPELYGAALHVEDAATALRAALDAPTGIFNVVADHGRVSNERFKAVTNWRPRHA